eukprot:530083_1
MASLYQSPPIQTDTYSSLYSQYLQNQQQWISSLFSISASALENGILSNVLKSIEADKNRKENLMMITLCQLMEKTHCNGALLQSILTKEDDEKQQNYSKQIHEYLNKILSILNQKHNSKFDMIENEIFDIKKQLKSNASALSNIYHEIKQLNAHNSELKTRNVDPYQTDMKSVMNKIKQMDKKIDGMKKQQVQINKHSEKQIKLIKQINKDNNDVKEGILKDSIALQSIKRQLTDVSLAQEQISSLIYDKCGPSLQTSLQNPQQNTQNHLENKKEEFDALPQIFPNNTADIRTNNTSNKFTKIMSMQKTTESPSKPQVTPSEPKASPSKPQTLSLKNNKNDASPQILSNNITDIRNNNIPNKCTVSKSIVKSSTVTTDPANAPITAQTFSVSCESLPTSSYESFPTHYQPSKQTETSTTSTTFSPDPSTKCAAPQTFTVSCENVANNNNNNNNILSKNRIGGNISQISNHSVNNQSTSTSLQNPHDITQNQTSDSSLKVGDALQHKKKEIDTSFTDTLTPQTLSLKNNKNDASPQILSNNMTDIRNNYIPNKSTKIATPAAQPTNNTANTHTLSSVSTTSIIPPSKPQQTTSFTNVTDPQILSLKNNKHDTSSQKFAASTTPQTLTTSSKVINDAYFPTYNPTTPTLSFTSKQKLRYYHEEHYKFGLGTKQDICIMDFERCTNFYKYRIDRNVKSLARNPFSAVGIIPSQDAIEAAINYKELGNEWYSKREFGHAIEQYQLAQKLDPTNAVYKLNESAATLMLKDYKRTIRCCEDALLYANDVKLKWKAYKRMGVVEERRGNINKCIEYYKKAQDEKCDADLKKKIKTICSKNT